MDIKEGVNAIQHANEVGLTVANPNVLALAKRLRSKPEKFIVRTQKYLPTVVEQQFYLAVAGDGIVKPETFASILRIFLGEQTLCARDLERKEVAQNLFTSKFDDVADFIAAVNELCNNEVSALSGYEITFSSAAKLLLEYGSVEAVEAVIDSILADWDLICERLNYNPNCSVGVNKAINYLINWIIPRCHVRGLALPLRFMDYYGVREVENYLLEEERDS
jgi:hypothetical protein